MSGLTNQQLSTELIERQLEVKGGVSDIKKPLSKLIAVNAQVRTCLLLGLYGLCVYRFWLAPLGSSFWVDEAVTAFVVRFGGEHASLRVAPQVPQSLYYVLPSLANAWFGLSEVWYRVPSMICAALTAVCMARIARRLISPTAGWFVAFGCFAIGGINSAAVDARPYALGMLIASASVVFLVRWLDRARWTDAALFVLFAALLWRTHLVYWPFYLVFPLYAAVRLARRETTVGWRALLSVFLLLGLTLVPVALRAIELSREAASHVIVPPPTFRNFKYALKFGLLVASLPVVWLAGRILKWSRNSLALPSGVLLLGWWFIQPLCLFAYSRLTENSVFVSRYLSLCLPGVVLGTTFILSRYVPERQWMPLTLTLGAGLLLFQANWTEACPLIHNSDWRGASTAIAALGDAHIPVICPSPFIEAKPPVWSPRYALPGFLYAHLSVYPVAGRTLLFPFENSPQAEQYASKLISGELASAQRFAIYGSAKSAHDWRRWFTARMPGWTWRSLGPFGDVDVVVMEKPADYMAGM